MYEPACDNETTGLARYLDQQLDALRGAIVGLTDEEVAYLAGFALTDDERAVDTLAAFDAARTPYLEAVAATDPDERVTEPPAPWDGIYDSRPANARFYLVHQVEEMARHAGHADILREQIDGMAVPALVLSAAGSPANDFFQPYVPAPGTLAAG
jgi:hypothetical protein